MLLYNKLHKKRVFHRKNDFQLKKADKVSPARKFSSRNNKTVSLIMDWKSRKSLFLQLRLRASRPSPIEWNNCSVCCKTVQIVLVTVSVTWRQSRGSRSANRITVISYFPTCPNIEPPASCPAVSWQIFTFHLIGKWICWHRKLRRMFTFTQIENPIQ